MPPRATSWPGATAGGPRPPSTPPRPTATAPVKPATAPIKPATAPIKPAVRVSTPTTRPPSGTTPTVSVKRPGGPEGGAAGPAAKRLAAEDRDVPQLKVSTQSKKDEIGIQTLVGDYAVKGTNHDRKYYQKVQKIQGHENIKVFLYYWDARDGPDFCGWWFGDEIGGSQVWARSNSHGVVPPRIGWKIPWDAPKAEPGILLVDPYSGGSRASASTAAAARAAPAAGAAGGGSAVTAERVKRARAQVEEMEASVQESLGGSKAAATPQASEEALREVYEGLQQQQAALLEVQKALTSDINEARKGGVGALSTVTELSRLSPRVRGVQTNLTAEINKVKGLLQRALQSAQSAKKQAENQEQQKKAEEKDSQDLQDTLPSAMEVVTAAEDSVESVALMASPLIAEPPDNQSEILKMAMDEIEVAAQDGQNKITEARKTINLRLQVARRYAPDTRRKALTEYSALQQKLTDAQKKLNPFKAFRKEFAARVEAKKALAEIAERLASAELEVEKATMTSSAADQGQMSDDEVSAAEEMTKPAQQGIAAALRLIEQKLRGAEGAIKDELNDMKERGTASRKNLDSVIAVLRKQREGLTTQQVIAQATEEVIKAEDTLNKCQEAEMPFLKGLEVLPAEESTKAITNSEAAAAASEKLMNHAKVSIRTKLGEAKRYTKEVAKSVTDDLNDLMKRLEAAAKKLAQFKQETIDRKMASVLAEVVEGISTAEKKVADFSEVAKIFSSGELEKVSTEALKEACARSAEAEREASAACLEARKIVAAKQREAKGGDTTAAIAKLQARLTAAHTELAKSKKAAASGEKLITGKELLTEQEDQIAQAEAEVEKAEETSKPREDLGEERLSEDRISEMVAAVESAQKILKALSSTLGTHLPTAVPAVKTVLERFKERGKKAQEKLNSVLVKTKDQREKVQCENSLKEAAKKADEVDAALEKVSDAELPFLKGIEVLPLTLAAETIKESELAASTAQSAISQARTFIAAKNLEVKHFAEAVAKPAVGEFSKLTDRINAAAAKLSAFRKDTEGRKRTAQVQETGEKISAADVQVKKLTEAVEPLLGEEREPLTDEEALALCEKLSELSKEAQTQLDACRSSLALLSKDTKNSEAHKDSVQKMTAQLGDVSAEFAKAKKVSSEHEHKYTAKRILAEAAQKVAEMEEEFGKAREACAPLLERGGDEFLVQSSAQVLATVLREHNKKAKLPDEALFALLGGSAGEDGKVSEEEFAAQLEKLPETLSRDEVQFGEERRKAVAKCIDADKDGFISFSEFKEIFRRRYICVRGISVTDVFEVAKSKTTGKIEPKEILEALGDPKRDEATGLMRCECKSLTADAAGFVTIAGNQGTVYLEPYLPYTAFVAEMDRLIDEGNTRVRQTLTQIKAKEAELTKAGSKSANAVEARTEMTKSKAAVAAVLTSFDTLKKKAQAGKAEFIKKEQAEKNAHIEARERKEAASITADASARMAAVETASKRLEEEAKPLMSLDRDALEAFTTPLSVLEEVEKTCREVAQLVAEAKVCVKEQHTKVAKVGKGPLLEAKRELLRMDARAAAASVNAKAIAERVRGKCQAIVDARYGQVSAALRAEVQRRDIAPDKLFEEIASVGEDRVSEEALCAHLEGLEGLEVTAEHAKLICRHIEKGGISKRKFVSFVQQYFLVVKAIAITNDFDVGKAKTLRKAEADEVIEVLDGPRTDPKIGLTRIRGKSLTDSTEGWISVRGNQGTPFLQEAQKPFYFCAKEVRLEADFKSEGQDLIRTLRLDEVFELIEGPKKETFDPAVRVRGKACSDGATGWFTVKDRKGTTFAEVDGNFYYCSQSVAMTDKLDIKDCKVIRKLAAGENFTVLEGPVTEGDAGITRVKGKCAKDDQEGWVTTKGNAGTVYAAASSKHYCIVQEVPLQKKFATASTEVVRVLARDEMVLAMEDPKEEAFPPEVRVRGRAISDGAVGWITVKDENVKRWSPSYKCIKATPLHESVAVEGASVVRQLEVGERAELLEGPVEQGGDLRMRSRAAKDGAVGWATIRDGEDKRFLQPMP